MSEVELARLEELLAKIAAVILALKRKVGRGYQGPLRYKRTTLVVVAEDADGKERFIEPSEIADADPDVFARDFVVVPNGRRGLTVRQLLERFLPLVELAAPKAAGIIATLKGLFGR